MVVAVKETEREIDNYARPCWKEMPYDQLTLEHTIPSAIGDDRVPMVGFPIDKVRTNVSKTA